MAEHPDSKLNHITGLPGDENSIVNEEFSLAE